MKSSIDPEEIRDIIKRMTTRLRAARDAADAEQRAAIIQRFVVLRADVRRMFADCAAYNAANRHQDPVNIDPDGLLALLLSKLDAFLVENLQ